IQQEPEGERGKTHTLARTHIHTHTRTHTLRQEPKLSSCSLLKMTMKELTALAMPTQGTATDASTVPQVHTHPHTHTTTHHPPHTHTHTHYRWVQVHITSPLDWGCRKT